METIDLIAITSNSDTTDGRGYTIVHGYARSAEMARAIVQDKRYARYCCMNIQHPDNYKYMTVPATIKIFDSVNDFFENTNEAIRERAIAKLTAIERKVLGIE